MNRLSSEKRAQILHLLVEGSSLRGTGRLAGVSYNTVVSLAALAGRVCQAFHDENVVNLSSRFVQCDELWTYCYAKSENLWKANPPRYAGDIWTWVAIDNESKLVISWLTSPSRGSRYANRFMRDLRSRVDGRVQITTDGWRPYIEAVERAFGSDADYGQRAGLTEKRVISGNPNPSQITNTTVERHNLTMRMSMKRYARLSNGISKKVKAHNNALALYFLWYNYCRPHMTLGSYTTPAMAAGLTNRVFDFRWIVSLLE